MRVNLRQLGVTLVACASTMPVWGQGTLNFNTRVLADGIDARCVNQDGITPLAGSGYLAQLYTGLSPDSLTPVGSPIAFRTGAAAGWLNGGEIATTIPFNSPGFAQVKAWQAAAGATYEAACASLAPVGESNIIPVMTGGGGYPRPTLAGNLIGLQGWCLSCFPEPSTFWLCLLGAGVLWLRRKRG